MVKKKPNGSKRSKAEKTKKKRGFDEEIQNGTSLPPSVDGQLRCFLQVSVTKILWTVDTHPADVLVRLKWWGEEGTGTLFRPVDPREAADSASSRGHPTTSRHPVCSGPKQFTAYLNDMGTLVLDVVHGPGMTLLGRVLISEIGQLSASNPVHGFFPVTSVGMTAKKIADLYVAIKFESVSATYNRLSSSVPTVDTVFTKGKAVDQDVSDSRPTPPTRVFGPVSPVTHPKYAKDGDPFESPAPVKGVTFSSASPQKLEYSVEHSTSESRNPLHGGLSPASSITAVPSTAHSPNALKGSGNMTVREANQEAAREPFSNDKQQTGMGVDLIGELLDKGHRLRQAMAVTSQDEDNEHLLPTHNESSHVPPGGLLREILNKDNRRKRLMYPDEKDESTLDDPLPQLEGKAVDLLLGEEISYIDRSSLSSPDDSVDSEPDDPLHDESLLKDLFYTTRGIAESDSENTISTDDDTIDAPVTPVEDEDTERSQVRPRKKASRDTTPVKTTRQVQASSQREGRFATGDGSYEQSIDEVSRVNEPIPTDFRSTAGALTEYSGVQSKATSPTRLADFVDSLGVEKLTALGRVNSARVELDNFAFIRSDVAESEPQSAGTYFIEYQFPVVTSAKDNERHVAMATELTRVASKKVLGQAVNFSHHCVFPVLFNSSVVDYWWNRTLIFKVFHRQPGQRTPSVVGSAALPLRTVLHSASLSYRSSLDVKDKIETDATDETRSSASSKQQTCSPPPPFYWSADMQHSRPGGQTCAVGSLMVKVELLADGKPVHISLSHAAKPPLPAATQEKERPTLRVPLGFPSVVPRPHAAESLKRVGVIRHDPSDVVRQSVTQTDKEPSQQSVKDLDSDTLVLHTLLWVPEGKDVSLRGHDRHGNVEVIPGIVKSSNPYLVCRMFWSEDSSRSQVCWGTTTPQFGFKQVIPVLLTQTFLQRACNNFMVIEVLDKSVPPEEEKLVGLLKLPLQQFYLSFRDARITKTLMKSKYPVIAVDGWSMITSPFTGAVHGQLKVLLAMGTMEQVSALQILKTDGEAEQGLTHRPAHHLDGYSRSTGDTKETQGYGMHDIGLVEHQFEVTVEDIRGLSIFGSTVHGETDCFVQYHFPHQTNQVSKDKSFDVLPSLQAHRTTTTLCVPDPSFHDVARHTFVLPAGVPVQKHLLAAFSGSWVSAPQGPRSGIMNFELWRRFYYPNVRDQVVAKASLPLAKLCAMVTMQKQGEASSQTFSLSLMPVPVEGHAPRQARALDTGLLDLTIKYRKTTAGSSQLGYTAQEDHVCIAVEVSRACGLKTAACALAAHNRSMAYPAEVGVNTFVVVKMPFGKRPEYRVGTVARTFAPEFAHHSEFLMPVVFRENVDESACSLAEILENSEAVFEVWHETVQSATQMNNTRDTRDVLLGVVKVPLYKLLTNRTGIKGWQPVHQVTPFQHLETTSRSDDGSRRQSPVLSGRKSTVGGLEFSIKFTEPEDREGIINKACSMGWAPLPGIESDDEYLLEVHEDRLSQSSSNRDVKFHLTVSKAWIPVSLVERVGATEKLRKDTVVYVRYKFYDRSAVCSRLCKLRQLDEKNNVCELKHRQSFTSTESAALVWYIREEQLEVQVWLSQKEPQGRGGGAILPRKRDRLLGAAFVDLSSLVEQRKRHLQLSGIFPLMKAGARALDGACVHVQLVVAKPDSSSHHWHKDQEQGSTLLECDKSSDGSENTSSTFDDDTDVIPETHTEHARMDVTTEHKSRVDAVSEKESFPVHITVDHALHLPLVTDAGGNRVKPNTYVSYQLPTASSPACTSIVQSSVNPTWEYQKLERFHYDMLTTHNLIFKVWHRPDPVTKESSEIARLSREADESNGSHLPTGDKVLGCVTVDISPLTAGMRQLVGWYNIMGVSGDTRGQMKVGVSPVNPVSPSRTLSSSSIPFGSQALDSGLPGVSLSYNPPFSTHLEVANTGQELLSSRVDDPLTDVLSSQIQAHLETLRKLKSARGCGPPTHEPSTDPHLEAKQNETSCSQSFLFSQLRRNIKELDTLHENLKAKLSSVDSHPPETDIHLQIESSSSAVDGKGLFENGSTREETRDQAAFNLVQSEKHSSIAGGVSNGELSNSSNQSSEKLNVGFALRTALDENESPSSTYTNFQDSLNSKSPDTVYALPIPDFGRGVSSEPFKTGVRSGMEQQNSGDSDTSSSCGEERMDSFDETSSLNDNMAKFKRYMDEKDSWLSSDDELKEEQNAGVAKSPTDMSSVNAHPEVLNAIKYVTNLGLPPDTPGMSTDGLDFGNENATHKYEAERENEPEHNSEADYESEREQDNEAEGNDGDEPETQMETNDIYVNTSTYAAEAELKRDKVVANVDINRYTAPLSDHFATQTSGLDHRLETGRETVGENVRESNEPFPDSAPLSEHRVKGGSLPNFFMPTKQLEQSMRVVRLGATVGELPSGALAPGAHSRLLDRVNKAGNEEKQRKRDSKLRSEFARRELLFNSKKNSSPPITTTEAQRIAKIFATKIP